MIEYEFFMVIRNEDCCVKEGDDIVFCNKYLLFGGRYLLYCCD